MKKSLIAIIVIAAVLIIAGGIGLYLSNQNNAQPVTETQTPSTGTPETAQPTSGTQTHNIELKSFAFNPAEITINVGDTVIWTNMDSVSHTITSDSGTELNSPTLSKGKTFSYIFNTAGTHEYHCSIHSSMKGKVIVE